MGYRVLLIAVRGKSVDEIHDVFGVVPTNEFADVPDAPVNGAVLPDGTYLLYVNDQLPPGNALLAKLSHGAELWLCYVNETVMDCFTAYWSDGQEQWAVYHDCNQGLDHLSVQGMPPPPFGKVRQEKFARLQAATSQPEEGDFPVDYVFDIPVELFAALTGAHYAQDLPGANERPWQVLRRKSKSSGNGKKRHWPFR